MPAMPTALATVTVLLEAALLAAMLPVLRELETAAEPGWIRRWDLVLALHLAAAATLAAAWIAPARLWTPVLAPAATLLPAAALIAASQRPVAELPSRARAGLLASAAAAAALAILEPAAGLALAAAAGAAGAIACRGCRAQPAGSPRCGWPTMTGALLIAGATALAAAAAASGSAPLLAGATGTVLSGGLFVTLGGAAHLAAQRIRRLEERVEMLQRENELLASKAEVDPLTGCANRHALRDWFERWDGTGPVTLLVVDVDHLKEINDRYGHAAGDQALQLVARILRDATRETDLVVRWGGDEFVAVLQDIGEETARLRYAHLVRLLTDAAEEFPYPIPLRASWGVAACTDRESVAEALHEADRRMYEMKRQRRSTG